MKSPRNLSFDCSCSGTYQFDNLDNKQNNSCILLELNVATRVIPNYSLYGVQALPSWQSSFDFEWIPQRSRPYNYKIMPHKHDAFFQILYPE